MIAVTIPAFKTKINIESVLANIGPEVGRIYVIDDGCPDHTGNFVLDNITDKRIEVIFHTKNMGIGAAILTGYKKAIKDGCEIIVKIDSDGQMNPKLINAFIQPLIDGVADYTKGNRFSSYKDIRMMPLIRIFGNMALSLITKFSSGYWNIFDPTNGFTAIRAEVASELVNEKIAKGYFFESDLLFWLYITGARVQDIPMKAIYQDEKSSLSVFKMIPYFLFMNIKNFFKRIFITYFIRDLSIHGISLISGILLLLFGISFGAYSWKLSIMNNTIASSGTVMLAALPVILGLQLLIYFFAHDIQNYPKSIIRKISKNQ